MSSESTPVRWLEPPDHYQYGTTFGLPWARGKYKSGDTTYTCSTRNGENIPLQSWVLAYWPDDSIKWTAHAIPAGDAPKDGYIVHATVHGENKPPQEPPKGISIQDSDDSITVSTGAITATFPKSGRTLISSIINNAGRTVSTNGHLVLLTQSSILDGDLPSSPITHHKLTSTITSTTLERAGPIRTTIKITGHHAPLPPHPSTQPSTPSNQHETLLLPFTLRIHLHASSPLLRLHLTHVFSPSPLPHPYNHIRGLALRLTAPLAPAPPYDQHIRLTTASGSTLLAEAAQGLTGLWTDPGAAVRAAQVSGQPVPPLETWDAEMPRGEGLRWVPVWRQWRLTQLGPDACVVRKRTGGQAGGRAWVGVPPRAGAAEPNQKAGGVAYVGAAGRGGVAVGLRWFWERWPTGLDVGAGGGDDGELTAWLWSPDGGSGPMDLRPWRGSLGEEGCYDEQLAAMRVTYEDWEEGMGSAEGVARTSELCLLATEGTPSEKELASLTRCVRSPPVLVARSERIRETGALGTYWSPAAEKESGCSGLQMDLDSKLYFLFNFYKGQVQQRKWYGFWDHGDIMHTYDADRRTWRYDVGGYAWDNSELSPDLWLWLYFLRTGRADVYRMAEALTRHTGEVDVYHLGKYKGLGTRHGVQHWSDSCKQARISNALYRRFFYYLSGGAERVGDLMEETLETEKAFLTLDPYRKVRKDRATYRPDPKALTISLGTDWSALAAAWFIEWERRGPLWEEAKSKLLTTTRGIGSLANGFVTGQVTYNLLTGEILPPVEDPENKGVVKVSHLSAMFGLFEICADILDSLAADIPPGFKEAWLSYCRYFNAPADEQIERFGVSFGNLQLKQGHSRLTAYVSRELDDPSLASRAWNELLYSDGYRADALWTTQNIGGHGPTSSIDEAPWISTNITSLYGLAAIQNLAILGEIN
ncbi:Secreted protein [Lasiodiplodia theobromae]|uniref:Secreted protein n=1 Tax=Lasiodiplodia theobromae TaxID=45133 RepID=UPI0015C3F465|nr:Secreted protein [Lasiodiplodia theobromae]KAF4537981.1 Secreted protein [Lasiodiplodia theobromae]